MWRSFWFSLGLIFLLSNLAAPTTEAGESGGVPAAQTAQTTGAAANSQAASVSAAAASGTGGQKAGTKPQTAAKAQDSKSSAKKRHKLPRMTFVVTATRMEQPLSEVGTTTSVVDSSQMISQKIQTVANVLRQIPGVQIIQSGSAGSETDAIIRGSTAAQTLVMVDGVAVNSGATGGFDLSNLTTDNLSRVEVVRGAGGALYGSSAIGGVINLMTEEGEGPLKMSYESEGGNRATQRQVFEFDGADGRFAYTGALSYFSTTGFRPRNDSADNLEGSTRLDYHLTENTQITGFARYIRSNVSLVDFSNYITPVDPNAHQRREFMLYNGVITHRFSDRLDGRMNVFFVRDDFRINDTPFAAVPAYQRYMIPEEDRGGNGELHCQWAEGFRSLVGFDFKDRWARSTSIFDEPGADSTTAFHARRQEYAGYVEQEGRFFKGLLYGTGGFRVDGNSQFGIEVSPSWSVAIPIDKWGLTLRGSYAEGFRAPSFNELYFPEFGNPALNPEISSEYDGGFTKTFGERLSFTTTYFSRRVHNLIVAAPCTTFPGCVMAANAGRADVQGVEMVPSVLLLPGLTLSGNYTVLDGTHVSVSPEIRPVRVPKHSAFGLLQYEHHTILLPHDGVTASLSYLFVGDRDDINPVTSTIQNHAGYHLFDLTLVYDTGRAYQRIRDEQLFARIQNLFDRNYAEAMGFPSPPVNFVAGVKVDF